MAGYSNAAKECSGCGAPGRQHSVSMVGLAAEPPTCIQALWFAISPAHLQEHPGSHPGSDISKLPRCAQQADLQAGHIS